MATTQVMYDIIGHLQLVCAVTCTAIAQWFTEPLKNTKLPGGFTGKRSAYCSPLDLSIVLSHIHTNEKQLY